MNGGTAVQPASSEELRQKQEAQESDEISGETGENGLPDLLASAVETKRLDPERLGQEKQNIYETNNFYFYGDSSQITMARNISDSNIQGGPRACRPSAAEESAEQLNSIEAMDRFLQKLYPQDSFFLFLTLIFLEKAKEQSLYRLAGQLRERWERQSGGEQEDAAQHRLQSQLQLQREILAANDIYVMTANAGKVQVRCLHLSDETLSQKGAEWFWLLFPDYRSVIVDWLFALAGQQDGFTAQCAREAVCKCAAFSFYDFQDLILPRFTAGRDGARAAWLANILRELLKNPDFSANTAMLIRHLTSLNNSRLVVVGLYLLDELDDPALERQAAGLLERALLGKLHGSQLQMSVLIAAVTAARHSGKVYALLLESLRSARKNAKSPKENLRLEDAYLHLSMGDYLAAGRSRPELLLLDLREAAPRDASLPLFLRCWHKPDFARFLSSIWDAYFTEAEKGNYSLEYTEIFWRRMAFQSSEVEFNRTCAFLREAERKHTGLAKFFRTMREQIETLANQPKRRIEG